MIIAFIGDNSHAREQAAKEFIGSFSGMHGSVAIDKFAGEDIDFATLNEAVSTLPFLSARRLIIVRDLGGNKELATKLENLCKNVADTTDFVLMESQIDNRSKFLSELKKNTEVREFTHLQGEDLVKWVLEQAKKLGGKIDRKVAFALIDRVGVNHQLLASELEKLILYQPEVTLETLQTLTVRSPQSSVFAMLDAAFSGNTALALKLYREQRALGMEPAAILGMIVWQLHILNTVKAAKSMQPNQIASEAKISPFVVRKNLSTANRLSAQKIMQLLDLTIETDKLLKRTSANDDDALQALIMTF